LSNLSDDELLDALGVDITPAKAVEHTPRQERIIAGFEDIQRFVETYDRAPRHDDSADIFERLYAVRLDRLRQSSEARDLLNELDTDGLLDASSVFEPEKLDALDDDALLDELGVTTESDDDITVLKHVRSHDERRTAEEIADRTVCKNFEHFKPLFEAAKADLDAGRRQTRRFGRDASIVEGSFFILSGQFVYVHEVGDSFKAPNGDTDARLRVIYDNGTESNLLLRSLQRALYKDETGRRLTDPNAGPLFSDSWDDDDLESGTIYVLRSLSEHPYVTEHRDLIHKIGVTGGKVETRIANAAHDATYLLADVEIIATYKLAGINRRKLEGMFHRIFSAAQIDLTIEDRFGRPVRPREWFLVPLHVIDEVVQRIVDGTIVDKVYDPRSACLVTSS